MRVNILVVVLGASIIFPNFVKADEQAEAKKSFNISATSKLEEEAILLKIKIKDAEPKSGVCPYFVKSFNYEADKKELSMEVYKEFCPNEQFGLSQGVSYWAVPKSMVGTKLCVLVNQNKVGALLIQGNKKSYRIYENCD